MGSYNARLIYPIGYSRRRCGATAALIRQPQTHPHNEEPEIQNRILWEGVRVEWLQQLWHHTASSGYKVFPLDFSNLVVDILNVNPRLQKGWLPLLKMAAANYYGIILCDHFKEYHQTLG